MVHFPRRRKGNDVDKLGFRLARQLEHRIVGHHLLGRVCRIIRFLRDFPLLILVVKGFRIANVVVAIHFRLDAGEVIGEAEVRLQPSRHLVYRFKQVRERTPIGIRNPLIVLNGVEIHRASVGVDNRHTRIPDVIELLELRLRIQLAIREQRGIVFVELRIRVVPAGDVEIDNPIEVTVVNDNIRVYIIVKKRRDMRQPVGDNAVPATRADLSPEHNPALRRNRRLAQDAEKVKPKRETEPPKPPA